MKANAVKLNRTLTIRYHNGQAGIDPFKYYVPCDNSIEILKIQFVYVLQNTESWDTIATSSFQLFSDDNENSRGENKVPFM